MEPHVVSVSALAPTFIRLELKWRRFEALRARLRESTFFTSEDDAVLYSQIDRIQREMYNMTKHLNPFEQEKLDELVVKAMRQKVLDDAVRDGELLVKAMRQKVIDDALRHEELLPDEDGEILSQLMGSNA